MEHLVQFDDKRRTLPGLDMPVVPTRKGRDLVPRDEERAQVLHGCRQLVPWGVGLSPATSATPAPSCQRFGRATLGGPPATSRRKEGMTSSQYGPYARGDTDATVGGTTGREAARRSQSLKAPRGSDRGLQLDPVKPESLVIAGQPYRGECVLGPCTHRPSHQPSGGLSKAPCRGRKSPSRGG